MERVEASDKKSREHDVEFFSSYPANGTSGRALYFCGPLNSARFEFISSAAKPLSMRVGLAVSVLRRGNNSRARGTRGMARKFVAKKGGQRNCAHEKERKKERQSGRGREGIGKRQRSG